jgi:hypothetical protein
MSTGVPKSKHLHEYGLICSFLLELRLFRELFGALSRNDGVSLFADISGIWAVWNEFETSRGAPAPQGLS